MLIFLELDDALRSDSNVGVVSVGALYCHLVDELLLECIIKSINRCRLIERALVRRANLFGRHVAARGNHGRRNLCLLLCHAYLAAVLCVTRR